MAVEGLVERCVGWSRREPSRGRRILTLVLGAVAFLLVLPAILIIAGRRLDSLLRISGLLEGGAWRAVGIVVGASGWILAAWSVRAQLALGGGTPAPTDPARRLVTSGPYALCRNPMYLGILTLYVGLALALGSPSAALLAPVPVTPLLAYARLVEERELEEKFGEEYVRYREATPFLIPRPGRRPRGGGRGGAEPRGPERS